MATDGFQYRPWGPWPSGNMQGPSYGQPFNYSAPQYTAPSVPDKPPLTHLQELTRVFPSPGRTEGSSDNDSGWGDSIPSGDSAIRDYCFARSSPDYHDQPTSLSKPLDLESRKDYLPRDDACASHTTPMCTNNLETKDTFYSARECDSGFVPDTCPIKDEEFDLHGAKLDLQHVTTNFDSERGLPGFHQAFGSTEIGRFSRTDFFRQPSPQPIVQPSETYDRPRKAGRKSRLPRMKTSQMRRECKDIEREEKYLTNRSLEGTFDPVVPPYQPQYPMGVYPMGFNGYHDPYSSYPYERNYPRYPSYEYLRPYGSYPVEHHSNNHNQPWQSPYGSPHPQCNLWSSPPMHPMFRYDY